MEVAPEPAARSSVRPYVPADESAVLDLVNGDRLPGQPPTAGPMLAEALAGRSAANALYDRVGFREIDRLYGFTRRP